MGTGVVQFAAGLVIGIAMLVIGAAYVGRTEGAVRAVAALGLAALGLMLLADLLVAAGYSSPPGRSYVPLGMQIGGVSLALLALVLMLMGGLTGIVWSTWRRRFADVAVLGGALMALVAGVTLTAVSIFGRTPLSSGTQTKAMALAGFGLGTLAAALIAFWAVPIVRQSTRPPRRVTASGPPV